MKEVKPRADRLIWLDLEMTGLDPDHHAILEIGCVVTDNHLKVIAEGPCLVIHQSKTVLKAMDLWSLKQHGRSGLMDKVRCSRVSLVVAERQTLSFLKRYCKPRSSPLCGNSIGQDRRFLHRYMPRLNAFFHYRNIDVSSIKELVQRWYPPTFRSPKKAKTHHALTDIHESIDELRHYRRLVFR